MRSVPQLENFAGKRVVARYDFNMPLDSDKNITDGDRIRATPSTLNELRDVGTRIVILAHFGRPKGEPDPELSLTPTAVRLGELLDARVKFTTDVVGPSAETAIGPLGDGEMAPLGNVRFKVGEKSKDEAVRRELTEKCVAFGNLFVSSGLGVTHRKEVSAYDVAKPLPSAAGSLVEAKIDVLEGLAESPKCPFAVVLGGMKLAGKLAIIDNLLKIADTLIIDGGMAFTFLKVQGPEVRDSLAGDVSIKACTGYLKAIEAAGKRILLPINACVAPGVDSEARTVGQVDTAPTDAIPADRMGLDIGPAAEKLFGDVVRQARSVFWNGSMGVFEIPGLESGTRAVAQALAEISGISTVGGGDSASAVRALGFPEDASGYIFTGDGASLELMEGRILLGIAVFKEDN